VRLLRVNWHSLLFVALSTMCLAFCVSVSNAQQYLIEVKRGNTVQDKLLIAKTIVTEERLGRLKPQIKQEMSGLSDVQLAEWVCGGI
jgi:hypothetical protein